MARQELAIAKADVHALEEHVQELQEEVHNERETSAAARQRANVIERQMADHEREVRTSGGRRADPQISVVQAAIHLGLYPNMSISAY